MSWGPRPSRTDLMPCFQLGAAGLRTSIRTTEPSPSSAFSLATIWGASWRSTVAQVVDSARTSRTGCAESGRFAVLGVHRADDLRPTLQQSAQPELVCQPAASDVPLPSALPQQAGGRGHPPAPERCSNSECDLRRRGGHPVKGW